jgi:hypothetical protein
MNIALGTEEGFMTMGAHKAELFAKFLVMLRNTVNPIGFQYPDNYKAANDSEILGEFQYPEKHNEGHKKKKKP